MNKERHESFARFFESPTRESFRELLQFNNGEEDFLDFKREWQEFSKVARHMLAFSNSGGGVMVIGVEEVDEHLEAVGVSKKLDKADIEKGVRGFIGSNVFYEVIDFSYSASEYPKLVGKIFQVVIIEYKETLIPLISKNNGKNIKDNAIYVRRGTNSVEASYEELQKLLNIRISTQYSTSSEIKLEEHISQLKLLFTHIEKYHTVYVDSPLGRLAEQLDSIRFGTKELVPNSYYPEEDFNKFISRMIQFKKNKIEGLISK